MGNELSVCPAGGSTDWLTRHWLVYLSCSICEAHLLVASLLRHPHTWKWTFGVYTETAAQCTSPITVSSLDGRFRVKMGKVLDFFKSDFSIIFWRTAKTKVLRICPIWDHSGSFWTQIWYPSLNHHVLTKDYSCTKRKFNL